MPEFIPVSLLAWLAVLSLLSIAGAIVGLPWLLLTLPEDYFCRERRQFITSGNVWYRRVLLVLKNLLGGLLLLTGILMLVLPGQGLLTMLGGLLLMDFPGKYRLERRLVRIPRISSAVNWIRHRGHKPPFELD